jgi:hypothetical protein
LDKDGNHPTNTIKDQVADMTTTILHATAKNMEIQQIPQNMKPAPMQKHATQKRQQGWENSLVKGLRKVGRNPPVVPYERLKLRAQCEFVDKNDKIDPDKRIVDPRQSLGDRCGTYRDHGVRTLIIG